jgi:hypothetical protein
MDDTEISPEAPLRAPDQSVDEDPEQDLDARVKPEPIRPSVYGNTRGGEPAPSRPRKSPWRIFIYVFVFACLVAVSLMLRSSSQSVKTRNPSSTPSGNVLLPGKTASAPATGGPIVDSDFARTSCNRPDVLQKEQGFTLVAGFTTTAGTAAAWEDALSQGSQTSPLHELPPAMKVAVCYIDGPWQPPQNVADVYRSMGVVADRAISVVPETGTVSTGPIAPHDSLPILQPASPPASPHT